MSAFLAGALPHGGGHAPAPIQPENNQPLLLIIPCSLRDVHHSTRRTVRRELKKQNSLPKSTEVKYVGVPSLRSLKKAKASHANRHSKFRKIPGPARA